jgi:hypothetical protein
MSHYPTAPFHARSEPLSQLELDESGHHWQTIREIRNTIPRPVHKFKSKREVEMAVLLWQIHQSYSERRAESCPDHYRDEDRAAWFEEQKRMARLIERIEACLGHPPL